MRIVDAHRFPLLPNKLDGDLSEYERGYLDAQSNLNCIPTIDAVPVVRCKDCKHCLIDLKRNDGLCMRIVYRERVQLDDFCSRGKRKEGEQ